MTVTLIDCMAAMPSRGANRPRACITEGRERVEDPGDQRGADRGGVCQWRHAAPPTIPSCSKSESWSRISHSSAIFPSRKRLRTMPLTLHPPAGGRNPEQIAAVGSREGERHHRGVVRHHQIVDLQREVRERRSVAGEECRQPVRAAELLPGAAIDVVGVDRARGVPRCRPG